MRYGDMVRISFTDRSDITGRIIHTPSDTGDLFLIIPSLWLEEMMGSAEIGINPMCSALVSIEVIG